MAAVIAAGVTAGALAGTLTGGGESEEASGPRFTVPIPTSSRQVGVPIDEAGCTDVREPEIQPSRIIAPEEKHPPYSSVPPTSGPHYVGPLSAAIYWVPNDPEALVANLAQGDIVVYHTGFDEIKEQNELKGLFVYLHSEEILATPGEPLGLKHPIVLTAWGKLQECEQFSGEAIHRFFDKYRGLGPGF
ncbi:MAG TPA: DUF3105 domain-containing protein [Actinomycetota bacterium]|nr:DUF3105 domain-containing protein [Actinomycetota bacterium]